MTASVDISIRKPMLTIADLIAQIEHDPALTLKQKQCSAAVMKTVVRIVAASTRNGIMTASSIACDVSSLNDCLFRLPAKAHKLAKSSFGSVISLLRNRLRRNGLLDEALGAGIPTDSPWTTLLANIKDAHCRYGLSKFAAWCDAHGIAPSEVEDGSLASFEAHVRTRHLRADIPSFISNIAKSWRKAASLGSNWPGNKFRAPCRRHRYTLPFSAYPLALQQDIQVFENRLGGSLGRGPFQTEGFMRPLRPRSVATRLYSIRQALTALVASGREPESITGLHHLVTAEAMEEILLFYWQRAVEARVARGEIEAGTEPVSGDGITSQTSALGSTLMIVARYHVRLPQAELEVLGKLASSVRRPTNGTISPRNRVLLDELCEPGKRRNLLRLPATLMAMADKLTDKPFQAALLAMTSIAIEIEFHKPLRLANLTELKLGENLLFTDPRSGRPTLLKIPAGKVKNNYTIEWPLSPALGERIRHYLVHHRPNLGPADSLWLFPAQCTSDRSRCHDTIRRLITSAIAEHVGVCMHVHLFRAFAGVLLLEANPGGLEDLRLLLDHKTLETSLAYYAYLQPAEVARRVDRVLQQSRSGIPLETRVSGRSIEPQLTRLAV